MIRIGIVGAGAIGLEHIAAIKNTDGCEFVAICDINIVKAKQAAEGTSAAIYTDYRDMQLHEKLDGVIINLPHFLHKEVTIYFLENKIPVLVEKPMAINVKECNEMIECSKKYNVPLRVGHVQRYFPCYRALRKMIEKKEMGSLCAVTETRNVDYFKDRPEWFLKKELSGGGILMNFGAHTLDKLFYTTGLSVNEVVARGNNFLTKDNVEASAQLFLALSGGVSAAFTYCGGHIPKQYETYFYFTDGAVKIENGKSLWIARGNSDLKKAELKYNKGALTCQLQEFVKLIKGQENELASAEYSREIVRILEEAFMKFEC